MARLAGFAAAAALVAQSAPAAAQCDMALLKSHVDPARTRIYHAGSGEAALYFRTDLDVNTDGASRSYHPDDPRGRTLALNNMGNAMTGIWDAQGRRIDCAPRRGACFTRWIETFVAARDARYNPAGHPRFASRHIIPWQRDSRLGWSVPCTIASGPYRGYFVSQTAFIVDPARAECDQSRYLDSLAFNAAVLPGAAVWMSQGRRARVGDLVVVHWPARGRTRYAIIGDSGPQAAIGEGTIALAASLRETAVSPTASYAEIRSLAIDDVQYLIFPGTDIRRRITGAVTQAAIDREAAQLFGRWGGTARLGRCAPLPRAGGAR